MKATQDPSRFSLHDLARELLRVDECGWQGNFSDAVTDELFRLRLVHRDHDDSEYFRLTSRGEELVDLLNLACTGA